MSFNSQIRTHQVRKVRYIITRDYYDPSTGNYDSTENEVAGRALIGIGNVFMTIDDNGDRRVKATGSHQ